MADVEWTNMQDGALGDAGIGDLTITGLAADSRKAQPGFLFAALPGTRANGRGFIADAIQRGAVAVLAEDGTDLAPGEARVALFTHPNPRREYARLAARFYAPQPAAIAAVTGTNGKSSTAEFTRQIWTGAGHAAASLGTLGLIAPGRTREGGLTTPDPAELHADLQALARSGVEHLAIEASSHGLDQFRLDGLKVSAAAFTNLTRDHLDYHGTMERYRAAKLRLFAELLEPTGAAVINADDPYGAAMMEAARSRGATLLTYGRAGADLKLLDTRPLASGQALLLEVMGSRVQTVLPLIGEFQAMNALAALGLAIGTGVMLADAVVLLATLKGARGRVEHAASLRSGAAVYVDYAHTPDALERVLLALRPHASGKLAVVFGCGGDRDKGKRPLMGAIAARLADRVYVTDDNPRSEDAAAIRRDVLEGAPSARDFDDRERAIYAAVEDLRAGDILVLAGKGHEQGQIVGTRVLPFDDAEVARRAVREVSA
jgi:UDP-N-acetylmuramoyl-L-alanyl-D-glutamate--2,6-diaminopimelate ligase